MKRNLIIAMANEHSVHCRWLDHWTEDCGWDLAIFNYGNSAHIGTVDLQQFASSPKFKWVMMNQLLDSDFPYYNYKYIWLVDDDIEMSSEQISIFFSLCEERGITLAQPSLTTDSYVTHPITLKHRSLIFRRVNFVEIMMPCFHTSAWGKLKKAKRYETLTGWGLELYWQSELFSKECLFHIFDDLSVRHSRPLGFGSYKWLPSGHDINLAMHSELLRHGIDKRRGWFRCNFELVCKTGESVKLSDPSFYKLLIEAVACEYRESRPEVAGIAYIKLSSNFQVSMFPKFKEIPSHASFGEYLLTHVFLGESF